MDGDILTLSTVDGDILTLSTVDGDILDLLKDPTLTISGIARTVGVRRRDVEKLCGRRADHLPPPSDDPADDYALGLDVEAYRRIVRPIKGRRLKQMAAWFADNPNASPALAADVFGVNLIHVYALPPEVRIRKMRRSAARKPLKFRPLASLGREVVDDMVSKTIEGVPMYVTARRHGVTPYTLCRAMRAAGYSRRNACWMRTH